MENRTLFNLNAAVENWRQELAAQPNLASDDRRELETHLRDAIAGFQLRGLNDEESFWLARRRVGQPQQLGEEFVKADPANVWRERVFWMWLAVFLSITVGTMARSLSLVVLSPNVHADTYYLRLVAQILLSIFASAAPLVAVILLAKGKLIPQFSKLMSLVGNRKRLTVAALCLVMLSSTIRIISMGIYLAKIPTSAAILQTAMLLGYALVAAWILVWLLPTQNQKTPEPG